MSRSLMTFRGRLIALTGAGALVGCLAACGSQTTTHTQSVGNAALQPVVARTATSTTSDTQAVAGGHHELRHCDPNVEANALTSCPFAENVFRAYAHAYGPSGSDVTTIAAFSPVTGQSYALNCHQDADFVSCVGGQNAGVRFPLEAVAAYEDTPAADAAPSTTGQSQTSSAQGQTQAP